MQLKRSKNNLPILPSFFDLIGNFKSSDVDIILGIFYGREYNYSTWFWRWWTLYRWELFSYRIARKIPHFSRLHLFIRCSWNRGDFDSSILLLLHLPILQVRDARWPDPRFQDAPVCHDHCKVLNHISFEAEKVHFWGQEFVEWIIRLGANQRVYP